jgi:hypothetical protein
METLEEKNTLLSYFGKTLTFPNFTILGINGEDYSNINFEVDAISHRAIIQYFQITQEDWNNFSITEKDTFSTTVGVKTFNFRITQKPFVDIYGWVKITANLVSIV